MTYVNVLNTSIPNSNWETGPSIFLPPNKYSKIVSLKNKFLFSIGGIGEDNILINDVYTLDLSNYWKYWVKTKSMIFCRQNFAVCVNENHIYIVIIVVLYLIYGNTT